MAHALAMGGATRCRVRICRPYRSELGRIEEGRHPRRTRRYRAARQAFGCNAERPERVGAPAREAAAKGLWEARQAGHVAVVASRSPDPLPVRKCVRGPGTHNAAPSGAHRQMRGTECVHSPAPFIGRRRMAVGGPQSNRQERVLCLVGLPGEHEKRAGTVPGSRPVGSLRTRRA